MYYWHIADACWGGGGGPSCLYNASNTGKLHVNMGISACSCIPLPLLFALQNKGGLALHQTKNAFLKQVWNVWDFEQANAACEEMFPTTKWYLLNYAYLGSCFSNISFGFYHIPHTFSSRAVSRWGAASFSRLWEVTSNDLFMVYQSICALAVSFPFSILLCNATCSHQLLLSNLFGSSHYLLFSIFI